MARETNRLIRLAAALASGVLAVQAAQAACPSSFKAGHKVVQYLPGLKAAVWYPTSAVASVYTYPGRGGYMGRVALNAPISTCRQFPLVVFSHGDTGCGTQSIFLTEELARDGYIVVAPDHLDALCASDGGTPRGPNPNNEPGFTSPGSWTPNTYRDRYVDIENVLTWALSPQSGMASQIDQNQLGIMGHSLGGYTAVSMLGGWSSWKDARFKAGLLLSPYLMAHLPDYNAANHVAYDGVSNPLAQSVATAAMYQGGTMDAGITPWIEAQPGDMIGNVTLVSGGGFYLTNGPAPNTARNTYYAELQGAGHFAWSNAVCASHKFVPLCYANVPNASYIHQLALAFFEKHLRGISQPNLTTTGFGLGNALATYWWKLSMFPEYQ